jgi:hypothetical protein
MARTMMLAPQRALSRKAQEETSDMAKSYVNGKDKAQTSMFSSSRPLSCGSNHSDRQ